MKWLHLSDIHFNFKGFDSINARDKLLLKLKELNIKVDFILITGDCLYKYGKESVNGTPEDVVKYIKDIAKACNCNRKNVYICQGNHDVSRESEHRNKIIEQIRQGEIKFDDKYDELNKLENEKFQMIVQGVTSYGYDSYKVFSPKNKKFRIVSLNSCLTSKDKDDFGQLRLCNEKLAELKKNISDDDRINILIMHHGIEMIQSKEARKFEHWIEDRHIDMVFCGHTHRAAIETCDDTYRDIKQFTAGAVIVDGDAVPSFYLCEYEYGCEVIIKLYTYSQGTENWDLDNHNLRKFKHGVYTYELSRKLAKEQNPDIFDIEKYKELIHKLNKAYEIKYASLNVRSNNFNGYDEFDASKIISSLSAIDMPYAKAIEIACKVVEYITSDKFQVNDGELSCFELRNIIYDTIVSQEATSTDKEFTISCWASRYARRYNRNTDILIQTHHNKKEKLDYSYIHDTLLKHIFDKVTGSEIYYLKTFKSELKHMSERILDFLKNMGVFEIREEVLNGLVEEYITQKPHPWIVKNEKALLIYHIEQAESHVNNLKDNNKFLISQTEAAYHICAAILLQYDKFIGSRETSPITILRTAINEMHGEIETGANKLPIQKHKIVQLKKDLVKQQINFIDFEKDINIINEYIVDKQIVTSEKTKDSLLRLWNILMKLEQKEVYNNDFLRENPVQRIKYIFEGGNGFIVQSSLKSLPSCFWVITNWEMHEKKQQHLRDQLLVCVIDDINDIGAVYSYLYEENRREKEKLTEVVFALKNYNSFTSKERERIRERFRGNFIKCIFIQEENYMDISEERNWREILFDVICISRMS